MSTVRGVDVVEGKRKGREAGGTGRDRVTVFQSETGVRIVEGTVARITGGGKFVVQPIGGAAGVENGDQVIIFILDKDLVGRAALLKTERDTHT
ncbi:MAG TPA: hypothetical protein VKF15_06355 [Nitrososphaerales archaeon]|nr:hypothetical protein [Nitrososphaerales archaeon]